MRVKKGFILRTLCGEHIVVGEGLAQVNFNKMLTLNESAAYLWTAVCEKEFTLQDLTDLLTEKYDVTEERAAADAAKVAEVWIREGVVEE